MNNYEIIVTNQFKKDYKQAIKRGLEIELLDEIIRILGKVKNYQKRIKTMPLQEIG